MPVVENAADELVRRWGRVATESCRRIARQPGNDAQERARQLRAVEREAGDLAGILEARFDWPRKGAGR